MIFLQKTSWFKIKCALSTAVFHGFRVNLRSLHPGHSVEGALHLLLHCSDQQLMQQRLDKRGI